MGRRDSILVNSEKPRDAAMRNTRSGFVVLSHHSLLLYRFRTKLSVAVSVSVFSDADAETE